MSANRSHQVLHRMVPLICQSLTASDQETVWLEGLRLLANPKFRSSLAITSSIWLPLLLKGLDTSRSEKVNLAALKLLAEVADQLRPMKSCLAKSLQALSRDSKIGTVEELQVVLRRLDMTLPTPMRLVEREGLERRSKLSRTVSPVPARFLLSQRQSWTLNPLQPTTAATTPTALSSPGPSRHHPLLAEILARNLPAQNKTVRHAWSYTLLSNQTDNASLWLQNLFQATLEASAVPELVINSRVSSCFTSQENS